MNLLSQKEIIEFTLLYFKMAVMSLVPETKLVDGGKLISLGNLLARKTTWLVVLTTTSATPILSRIFGAYNMTKIVYKYSHFPALFLFHIFTYRVNTLFLLWLSKRTLSLYLFRPTDQHTFFSFLHVTFSSQPPRKYIPHATILFFVILFRWDFFQPRTQKFRQTTERNKQ